MPPGFVVGQHPKLFVEDPLTEIACAAFAACSGRSPSTHGSMVFESAAAIAMRSSRPSHPGPSTITVSRAAPVSLAPISPLPRSANDRSASRTAASTLSIRELTGSASLSDGLPATRESGQREAQRGLQRSGSWNFYFRVYPGAIRNPQVVQFLKHLMRHIPGRLLVVWDGLPSHRSRRVHDFVGETHGRPVLERLPSYAPEFNPVEYLWGYWKHHELRNFCPRDFGQRNDHAGGGAPLNVAATTTRHRILNKG